MKSVYYILTYSGPTSDLRKSHITSDTQLHHGEAHCVFFFLFCLVWLVHPEQSAAVCKTSRRRKTAAQMGLPYNQTQDEQYTTVKRVSTQAITYCLPKTKAIIATIHIQNDSIQSQ